MGLWVVGYSIAVEKKSARKVIHNHRTSSHETIWYWFDVSGKLGGGEYRRFPSYMMFRVAYPDDGPEP